METFLIFLDLIWFKLQDQFSFYCFFYQSIKKLGAVNIDYVNSSIRGYYHILHTNHDFNCLKDVSYALHNPGGHIPLCI